MRFLKYILLSLLLLAGQVGFGQNNVLTSGGNIVSVGGRLLYTSDAQYDVAASRFFDTIIARGGSLTSNEKTAINVYVIAAKGVDGWWDDTHADYPMVGGTVISCAVNLRNPGTFDLTFVNTVAGDFTSTGFNPDGITKYAKTGLIPSTDLTQNSASLEYYSRTNVTENAYEIGVFPDVPNNRLSMSIKWSDGNAYFSGNSGEVPVTNSNSSGSIILSRTAAAVFMAYRNGSVILNSTLASTGLSNLEVYIGALNNKGVTSQYSSKECAGAGTYKGLTTAQSLAQYTARQAMNTRLNREVN